jgi:hypothetical protein
MRPRHDWVLIFACVVLGLAACAPQGEVGVKVSPTPPPEPPGSVKRTANSGADTPTPQVLADCFLSFRVAAWQDLDGDGLWGESEPPLEGVEFLLQGMFAQIFGRPNVSDADGRLTIRTWSPGECIEQDYGITAVPPETYEPTTPVSVTFSSASVEPFYEAQFGFRAVSQVSIEGVMADGTCVSVSDGIHITSQVFRQARFEEAITSYLNEGGAVDALATSLAPTDSADEPILLQVVSQDVTGSGLPDTLMAVTIPYGGGSGEAHVLFFTCKAGRYTEQILFRRAGAGSRAEGLYEGGGAVIESLRDLNGNGVPDVLFSVHWLDWGEVHILEWDGERFCSLIEYENLLGHTSYWIEDFGGGVEIVDVEGDGLYEIVVGEQGGEETVIWRWDGERYGRERE